MKILISNDDGFDSFGIQTLAQELAKKHKIIIFAPDRDKSAASSSLTLGNALNPIQVADNIYKVDGTPSDCAHLALRGFFDFDFDLVVTGINFGANMGDDVVYSGTVAGAIEARFLGLPSIAFSLATAMIMTSYDFNDDTREHNFNFMTAAKIAVKLIDNIAQINIAKGTILNVNVPDIALSNIQGIQTTRLGKRHSSTDIRVCKDNVAHFYLGENGLEDDNSLGTDFYAISHNFVSVTPLHIDLTRYSEMDSVAHWLERI